MVHPLKNILNRLRWDTRENPENYLITYRHRGAPGDEKQIAASRISKLAKSYFTILDDPQAESEESTIPFHRVLKIHSIADGKIIWTKRIPGTPQH